ncbi:MAG: mechanosensitive ion channel family protein [Bacteroidetes bacterium]|nr:MAG: mechanosensitive ion channel family protein [Bacteroidota bacterium]
MFERLDSWLTALFKEQFDLVDPRLTTVKTFVLFLCLIAFCGMVWWISKKSLNLIIPRFTARTKTVWDDIILNRKVVNSFSHLIPAILLNHYAPLVFSGYEKILPFVVGVTDIFIVMVVAGIFSSFFSSIKEIMSQSEKFKDKPIGSFTQLAKIIVYSVATILVISIAIGKSPLYLLTGLGAMAAVIMLVFRDSILGFVASIQLSANDMVRLGDWVTVSKYGADGDVMEINLTTIKVRNFDRTITTIPTYAFINDSFKNWRGMEDSEGRRIKRTINIKIDSVHFCTKEELDRFRKIDLIRDYIEQKEVETKKYNEENQVSQHDLINGRNLTNVGVFRIYITEYLKRNKKLNLDMTCMVRQLQANEYGLPLEIYTFSKVKEWVKYESIMSDIFDHLFAAVDRFDLEVFERPAGSDLRQS